MYKFVKIKDDNNEFDKTNVTVTIPFNDITLIDLCEAFTDFLKACGFYIHNRKAAIIQDPDGIYDDIKVPELTEEDEYYIEENFEMTEEDLTEESNQQD